MVGLGGVAGALEVDDVAGLRGVHAVGHLAAGVGTAPIDKLVHAGDRVRGVGNHIRGDPGLVGTPGHEHGAPHILGPIPLAILGVVAGTLLVAGELAVGVALGVAHLGASHGDDVSPLITGEFHILQCLVPLAAPVGIRDGVGGGEGVGLDGHHGCDSHQDQQQTERAFDGFHIFSSFNIVFSRFGLPESLRRDDGWMIVGRELAFWWTPTNIGAEPEILRYLLLLIQASAEIVNSRPFL